MKGGFWMNCLRCGNEIPEGQMFCQGCREYMEQDPVPQDAVVMIPKRDQERRGNRKATLSTDEMLDISLRKVKRLRALTILLLLLLGFAIGFNVYLLEKNRKPVVGQNYSTVTSTAPSSGPLPTEG